MLFHETESRDISDLGPAELDVNNWIPLSWVPAFIPQTVQNNNENQRVGYPCDIATNIT